MRPIWFSYSLAVISYLKAVVGSAARKGGTTPPFSKIYGEAAEILCFAGVQVGYLKSSN